MQFIGDSSRAGDISLNGLLQQRAPPAVILPRISSFESWPSLESQDALIAMFSEDERLIAREWARIVIKGVVGDLDRRGAEMSDAMAEMAVAYSMSTGDAEEAKSGYILYTGSPILMTGKALVRTANAHNQVGMKVWSAGLFLAECLLAAPQLTRGRQVIELGAGTGCTGLILALSTKPPTKITMTDFDEEVMANLQKNIDVTRNTNSHSMCDTDCRRLDWMECLRSEVSSEDLCSSLGVKSPPVVIAADCCYSEDLIPSLLDVLSKLLSFRTVEKSSTNHHRVQEGVALIATMVRNLDTYNYFIKCLDSMVRLCYRDISDQTHELTVGGSGFQPMFLYGGRESIKVICVAPNQKSIDDWLNSEFL